MLETRDPAPGIVPDTIFPEGHPRDTAALLVHRGPEEIRSALALLEPRRRAEVFSCLPDAAQETTAGGRPSQKTLDLEKQYKERLEEYASSEGMRRLEAGGASVSRKRCRSMATEHPNDGLDTSDYQNPLQNRWGIGKAL